MAENRFADLIPNRFADLIPPEDEFSRVKRHFGGQGIQGTGRAIVGGVRDAAQSAIDLLAGGLKAPPLMSTFGEERPDAPAAPQLPEVAPPKSTPEALVRGVTQFVTGFIPGLQASKFAGVARALERGTRVLGPRTSSIFGSLGEAEFAALAAEQVVFDPNDPRLSNLIEEYPALQSPVTEFLSAKEGDSQAEARFKMALESAGIGLAAAPFVGVVRGVRAARAKAADTATSDAMSADLDALSAAREALAPAQPGQATPTSLTVGDRPPITVGDRPPMFDPSPPSVPAVSPVREGLTPQAQAALDVAGQKYSDPFVENLNIARIENGKDIGTVLDAATGGDFRKVTHGTQSHAETQALADAMGLDYDKLMTRRFGQAFNAQQAVAARNLLAESGEELVRLAGPVRGGSDEALVAFQKAWDRHVAIQDHVQNITSEAARALDSHNIVSRSDAGRARAIKELIDGRGGRDSIEGMAEMVASLDTPEKIAAFTRNADKAKTSDMVLEAWINALLSGPRTHVVNALSNTINSFWIPLENTVAAGFGAFRRNDKVYFGEGFGRLFGMAQGAKDGLALAVRSFRTEVPSSPGMKIEARRYQSIPSVVLREGRENLKVGGVPVPLTGELVIGGRQLRLPGRALMASDEFFKSVNYRSELWALAIRTGKDKGLSGDALATHIRQFVDSPPENYARKAHDAAAYATFTNPLGSSGRAVQRIVSNHPTARVIAPFIRTPTNIFKFATERTPLGLLMRGVRENLKGVNGRAARDTQMARIALGSTIMAGIATLTFEGHVTGASTLDSAERATLRTTGWAPYSVKIGENYYSYKRSEPLGMLLGMAADFAEISKYIAAGERDRLATMIVAALSENVMSDTWVRGPSELLEAVKEPERHGKWFIQKLAGTVIPTGVSHVAQEMDPVWRDVQTALDAIKARIPGKSRELPPVRNIWGEVEVSGGGVGPDMLSPIFTSREQNNPVADEAARLKMGIRKPPRKIQGIDLTPEQYSEYSRVAGQGAWDMLNGIISSPQWRDFPDGVKEDIFNRAIQFNRELAGMKVAPEAYTEAAMAKIVRDLQMFGLETGFLGVER